MKYQVVYQGYAPQPNQAVSDPLDLKDACWLASELQGEVETENVGQLHKSLNDNDFYVVEPIFGENTNESGVLN